MASWKLTQGVAQLQGQRQRSINRNGPPRSKEGMPLVEKVNTTLWVAKVGKVAISILGVSSWAISRETASTLHRASPESCIGAANRTTHHTRTEDVGVDCCVAGIISLATLWISLATSIKFSIEVARVTRLKVKILGRTSASIVYWPHLWEGACAHLRKSGNCSMLWKPWRTPICAL